MRRFLISAVAVIAWTALHAELTGQQAPVTPAVAVKPAPDAAAPLDLTRLSPRERQFFLSAKSGMDWLTRVNKPDGRFLPGFETALRVPLEGDSYLNQAAATWALARSAGYFRDERAAAVARQALLTLLLETTVDSQTSARYTAAPEPFLNRLATGGLLVLAIHELPQPASDLVQQGDQLAQHLRLQQQADGSFLLSSEDAAAQTAIIEYCTGWALYGIIRSQALRPAPWKLEALRKGRAHYHGWWRKHKNMPMVGPHSAAYAEAFAITKEQPFADAVFEMNDWLCDLQYANLDARRRHWSGGFQRWVDGKAVQQAPGIESAHAAWSLAHACRVAKQAGDAVRLQRYTVALEQALQFVASLQYTEANTQHFAPWYRQNFVQGGFFLSHQDGNLRVESTQQALVALVQYLDHAPSEPRP
jgi:hypothetical protein